MTKAQKSELWLKAGKPSPTEAASLPEGTERDPILQYIVKNPDAFAQNLARVLEHGGKAVAAYLAPLEQGQRAPDYTDRLVDMMRTFSHIGQYWMSDPQRALDAQTRLWSGYMDLYGAMLKRWAGAPATAVAEPKPTDTRFKDEGWTQNQFFDFLKQAYLLTSRWAEDLVADAEELDEHTRHKAGFYMRQLFDAISPSNFLLTNPELLRATAESSGENLARGMKMLAEDVEAGRGQLRLRQTTHHGFEVGRNMAVTPGKVIAENEVRQLIQYQPTTEHVRKTPILFVPPWINKFYILDLNPEKSMIKWLVDQGHTVFVVSWINPDQRHADKDFVNYMHEGILESMDLVQKVTNSDKMDMVGYCVGGTLLSMTLPWLAAKGDTRINAVTLLTTQVDFTYAGDLKVFVDVPQLQILERQMREKGFLEGSQMATAFNMLRANDLIWPYVRKNYILGQDPFPFDLLYWNSDATRMPYANHLFYLKNFYLENKLAKGELEVEGIRLDLNDVKVPVYDMATREDHIAPARSVFKGNKLFGGEAHFVMTGSGHIAGIVNPPAKKKYQFWSDGPRDAATLEDWIAGAKETPGSWWPHWDAWLRAHDSQPEEVEARAIGGGVLEPIEDAPGRYVKMRY